MPRIDFYLLQDMQPEIHWLFACRLLEKIYLQKHQVYVHTNNPQDSKKLDDLLWQFRDISFVPHCLQQHYQDIPAEIQIGSEETPSLPHHDILLNMNFSVPTWYQQFNRILIIVPQDNEIRVPMRAQYKTYEADSCELHLHKI